MNSNRALLWIVILSSLSGCATKFNVAVDSICSAQASVNGTYAIFPGNKGTEENDLIFKELSVYVDRALSARGFRRVGPPEEPDIVIILCYGISDPQQYARSVPVFGQTGVSSSTTVGTVSSYRGYATYSGTTTYKPSYGVTGYGTAYVFMFSRFIQLTAYEARTFIEAAGNVQVWRTTITSTGTSGDLRRVFPVMIAAAEPYLGRNTGKQIYVSIREADRRVAKVKSGIQ